jgi:PhnB protein
MIPGMKSVSPYLFFNGNCREAMQFYQKHFGGDLRLMTVADTKQEMLKDADQDMIMHSSLKSTSLHIMASDNGTKDTQVGDNVCIELECSSRAELDQLFTALSDGGEIWMKPQDTFWGAYFGTLTDQFGVSWLLNFQA